MTGYHCRQLGLCFNEEFLRDFIEHGLESSHETMSKLGYLSTSFLPSLVEGHCWGYWLACFLACTLPVPRECPQTQMLAAFSVVWQLSTGDLRFGWRLGKGWGGRRPTASATWRKTHGKLMPHIWTIHILWIHAKWMQVTWIFILSLELSSSSILTVTVWV